MAAAEAPFKRFHRLFSIATNSCWEWQSITGSSGYGMLKVFGKMVSAHRFSYELYKGEIPKGLEILHSCDNKLCVNPDHLRIGTHSENMRETIGKPKVWSKSPGRSGIRKSQSHPVLVLGVAYGSKKEAERSLGLGHGTVSYWIKAKPEKAKLISRETYFNLTSVEHKKHG